MTQKIPREKDKKSGWTIDPEFLIEIEKDLDQEFPTGMEEIENVLLVLISKGYLQLTE